MHSFSSSYFPSFQIFRAVANSLEVFGSSLNLVLYFCFVPDVRREMMQCLRRVRGGARGMLDNAKASRVCSNSTTDDKPSKATECVEV